jgi:hypothetical protein
MLAIGSPHTYIYIPARSPQLLTSAQTWNIGRATAGKNLHELLTKPPDKLERSWLKTRPLEKVQPSDKLYVLLCHEERAEFQQLKRPRIGAEEDRIRGWRRVFSGTVVSWAPDQFAQHLVEAGLNRDFMDLRLHVSFSRFQDDERGERFVRKLAKALWKNDYRRITVTGYRGMLFIPPSIGADGFEHRQAVISKGTRTENKRPSETRYSKTSREASQSNRSGLRAAGEAVSGFAEQAINGALQGVSQIPQGVTVGLFGCLQRIYSVPSVVRSAPNRIAGFVGEN